MIKALIVDDETTSIQLLEWLLNRHCPDVTVIKKAKSVNEAIPLIKSFNPDILFLDIQMPHQSGFDLLSTIEKWNFEVIFTTAFNEYAIMAIRFSALDYLLKPIDETELIKAVERFKVKRMYAPAGQELFRNFIRNISGREKEQFKLALPGSGEIRYVNVQDIIRLQAERNYTRIYFTGNKNFLSAKTLKEYEEMLQDQDFIRVHKSHLVNAAFMTNYDRDGWLFMEDGSKVEVARRKKEYLLKWLRKPTS
jgi:two-component system LytT family response regulator